MFTGRRSSPTIGQIPFLPRVGTVLFLRAAAGCEGQSGGKGAQHPKRLHGRDHADGSRWVSSTAHVRTREPPCAHAGRELCRSRFFSGKSRCRVDARNSAPYPQSLVRRSCLGLLSALAALALPVAAHAGQGVRLHAVVPSGPPPAIMPLADVRPGMVGQALTVFQGTKPEPFKVRVVSVMRNFLPKQDVILIRAEDPRVEFSGIVAGMSGSPVYIDGKLVGAVAYALELREGAAGRRDADRIDAGRAHAGRAASRASTSPSGQDGVPRLPANLRALRAARRVRRARRAVARTGAAPDGPGARHGRAAADARVRAAVRVGVRAAHRRGAGRRAAPDRAGAAASRRRPPPRTAGRRPRRGGFGHRRRAGARRHEHRRHRHRHVLERRRRAGVRPPAVRDRRGLPAAGRRRNSRVSPQPVELVQDVVAAERGRHADPGPAVLHRRRPGRALDHAAGRRARRRTRASSRACFTRRLRATGG